MGRHVVTVASSLLALGCGSPASGQTSTTGVSGFEAGDDETTSPSAETSTTTPVTTSTSGSSGPDTGTSSSTSTTDDVFTTEPPPDFEPTTPDGCRGKLDLVFVIGKNSIMLDQQPALLAGIPEFLTIIKETFADFDLHVLVLDGHGGQWGMSACEEQCTENGGLGCEPEGPADYPCYAYGGGVLNECDLTAGAGDTFPAGIGSANKRCEIEDDRRYLTSDDANFDEAFLCLTQIGISTGGKDKVPAMLHFAFAPEWGGPCNEGFLRDDALLVATLITDDATGGNYGTPEEWREALVAAKHGDLDAFVVLALFPDFHLPEPACQDGPANGPDPPMLEYVEGIKHSVWGSACADDFVPFFVEATDVVHEVCDAFVPQ